MRNAREPEPAPGAATVEDYGTFGGDFTFAPVDETVDPGLKRLFACWKQIRGERAMPTRPELNPFALRDMLRFTQMFDVVDEGRDFRIRVMGSGIVEQSGLQVTGKCVSELEYPQLRTRMHTALRRVYESGQPVRLTAKRAAVGQLAHKRTEAVYFPLGDETGTTHILSGVVFGKTGAAAAA